MKSLYYAMDSKLIESKPSIVKTRKNLGPITKDFSKNRVKRSLNDSLCSLSSDLAIHNSLEPSLEWIEEEMARVCGVGIENIETNPCESKPPVIITSHVEVMEAVPDFKTAVPMQATGVEETVDIKAHSYWQKLRIKNEAELERKLNRVAETRGIAKRARIEMCFTKLFGRDEEPIAERKPVGRKERDDIAALTVKHLMPEYKKQKIASRDLFKKLAKHISDCVKKEFSNPDEEDVQLVVRTFFQNVGSVNCDADIVSSGK